MSIRLVRAPAGAGKTQYVLKRLVETLYDEPFARIWVILASKRQEDAFRQRMIDIDTGSPVVFNVEFFNFYELYGRLLDRAGQPQRMLGDASRLALLRDLLTDLSPKLAHFGAIAHLPGFARVVGKFILELKQNRMHPEDYQQAAKTPRDHDLALIYAAYQDRLRRYNLVDIEGQGWLALEALEQVANDLSLLIVDGFDHFTTVQAGLIGRLAQKADAAYITLTRVAGLESTVGRRFENAFDRISTSVRVDEVHGVGTHLPQHHIHSDIRHLMAAVFRHPAQQEKSSGGIRFVEAPDEAAEVAAVLRQVKSLLLEGTPPDEIMIVLRNWQRYQPHLLALRTRYALPLVLHYGESLGNNPAVIALMELLQLHTTDFRRRELLSVLRSPYFDVSWIETDDVDRLEGLSLKHNVTHSRELWFDAIDRAVGDQPETDDEPEDELDASRADRLKAILSDFMGMVTPLDESNVADYGAWVNNLIGIDPDLDDGADEQEADFESSLNMLRCVRDSDTMPEILARDLLAIQEFKRVLHSLVTAHQMIATLNGTGMPLGSWGTFFAELQSIINVTSLDPRPARFGRVLVTSAADARGLPHDHVFILGLSEGGFPAPVPEDPLYLDHERESLHIGEVPLETRAQRASDDALFYELVALPRQSLMLSRPFQQNGTPWAASPFWRATMAVFTDAEALILRDRIGIGQVPKVENAASIDELALAVADALSGPVEQITGQVKGAARWLNQSHPALWNHILHNRQIELRRIAGFDRYSGKLDDAYLAAEIGHLLGPEREWSASQLNDYGLCGFRFFTNRILKLDALEEPEEGMDAAERGTLVHEILQEVYQSFVERGLAIAPANRDHALETLHKVAREVFASAPEKIGFRAGILWEYEQGSLLRMLEKFINADFASPDDNPLQKKFKYETRHPYLLEAEFRSSGKGESVQINLDDAGPIRLRGIIDRIDLVDDDAIVLDYKTGGAPGLKDLVEGRNFQMLVYLEGTRELLRQRGDRRHVRGGAFWKLSQAQLGGVVTPDDNADHQDALDAARRHIADNIQKSRSGDFSANPGKVENGRCVRYCEFSQFCRMKQTVR